PFLWGLGLLAWWCFGGGKRLGGGRPAATSSSRAGRGGTTPGGLKKIAGRRALRPHKLLVSCHEQTPQAFRLQQRVALPGRRGRDRYLGIPQYGFQRRRPPSLRRRGRWRTARGDPP